MRRFLLILTLLLALLVLLALFLLPKIRLTWLEGDVDAALEGTFGSLVEIDGGVTGELWPQPTLVLKGVRFIKDANRPSASPDVNAVGRFEELRLGLSWAGLTTGQLRLERIAAREGVFEVALPVVDPATAGGRQRSSKPDSSLRRHLKGLDLSSVSMRVHYGQQFADVVAADLSVTTDDPDTAARLNADVMVNNQPVSLSGQVNNLADFFAGRDTGLKVTALSEAGSLRFATSQTNATLVDILVRDVEPAKLAEILPLPSQNLLRQIPLALSGTVQLALLPSGWELSDVDLFFGKDGISGKYKGDIAVISDQMALEGRLSVIAPTLSALVDATDGTLALPGADDLPEVLLDSEFSLSTLVHLSPSAANMDDIRLHLTSGKHLLNVSGTYGLEGGSRLALLALAARSTAPSELTEIAQLQQISPWLQDATLFTLNTDITGIDSQHTFDNLVMRIDGDPLRFSLEGSARMQEGELVLRGRAQAEATALSHLAAVWAPELQIPEEIDGSTQITGLLNLEAGVADIDGALLRLSSPLAKAEFQGRLSRKAAGVLAAPQDQDRRAAGRMTLQTADIAQLADKAGYPFPENPVAPVPLTITGTFDYGDDRLVLISGEADLAGQKLKGNGVVADLSGAPQADLSVETETLAELPGAMLAAPVNGRLTLSVGSFNAGPLTLTGTESEIALTASDAVTVQKSGAGGLLDGVPVTLRPQSDTGFSIETGDAPLRAQALLARAGIQLPLDALLTGQMAFGADGQLAAAELSTQGDISLQLELPTLFALPEGSKVTDGTFGLVRSDAGLLASVRLNLGDAELVMPSQLFAPAKSEQTLSGKFQRKGADWPVSVTLKDGKLSLAPDQERLDAALIADAAAFIKALPESTDPKTLTEDEAALKAIGVVLNPPADPAEGAPDEGQTDVEEASAETGNQSETGSATEEPPGEAPDAGEAEEN